ncbi:MAG TPA: HAD-IC family P-type ATPase [Candidatus Limnocylindrales bacterium]|nr:HAD-IC family P-type ATPase [Candidatus Limnocylindrales bacterium]
MAATTSPVGSAFAPTAPERPWHALEVAQVLAAREVDPRTGLSTAEVLRRRATFGPNTFTEQRRESALRRFLRQYADPMQVVLLVAGLVSILVIGEEETGALLILITLANAGLGVYQEGKAAKAVAALAKMMVVRSRVIRDGILVEIAADELVPGDIVAIEAGDVVTADGRIIEASSLEIAEAALTGESLPAAKSTDAVDEEAPLGDRDGMAFMNTNVTRGSGRLVVTAIGNATEVGHISTMLQADAGVDTPLTRQINTLTHQLLVVAGIALAASIMIGLWRGVGWEALFVSSVAFAVSAIPTSLPMVVTTILSFGTQTLAKAGAIVKQLRSVETLGSTSAINSDKTGTLTLNEMTAVELAIPWRRYTITGSGYGFEGRIAHTAGEGEVRLDPFLVGCVLASDAVVRDGDLIGDPTEGALVVLAEKAGISAQATRERYPRVSTLPFDAAYKLMATFHRVHDDDGREIVRAFVKGAPDKLLARSSSFISPDLDGTRTIDGPARDRYVEENERLGAKGLRVMAIARRDFDAATFDPSADLLALLDNLVLLALVGIVDPPRPSAKASIAAAQAAGITVRMVTGDHAGTAAAIARELGIPGRAISGTDLRAMNENDAMAALDDIGVIARVTPEDKVRLVELLRKKGDIVAMTGDGVNDAPALRRADIGIAMGITGTEVSKEAATMILTDDDFSTIVRAVELGRALYQNMTRFVRYEIGSLYGFMAVFLGASVFNIVSGVPFEPLQTLWFNFTGQALLAIGLGYGAPTADLMERAPRRSGARLLSGPMMGWMILVGLVMGAITLPIIGWAANTFGPDVARTMGISTFALLGAAFAIETRDERRSILSAGYLADRTLLLTVGATALVTVLAAEVGIVQRIITTVPLTIEQWLVCFGGAGLLLIAYEIRKLLWIPTAAPARER